MRLLKLISVALVFSFLVHGQEPVDLSVVTQIKKEGFQNSQVEETLFFLTDVHGPRLTNSPGYFAAAEWCVDRLTEWGLENAQLEPWGTFGQGWEVERFSIEMIEPRYLNIIAYPKAWTPGTEGIITGEPVLLDIETDDDFNRYRGQLADAIVMIKSDREAKKHFEPDAKRRTAEELAELALAPEPRSKPSWWKRRGEYRRRRELREKISQFLIDERAAVILEASEREHGTIRVHRGGSFRVDADSSLPALTLAIEHYSRLARLLRHGIPVQLRIHIQTNFFPQDSVGYNVVAEMPGTGKQVKDQLVMLGGHLDSWHAGTGATDNAAGCVVAMEAVRILQAIGVKPRRTVRIALWGGEEQGLLGSRGYVEKHFGDRYEMTFKPDHAKFSAYYNLDNGSGKIRGIFLQGNDAVRPIFEAYLKPFHDLGATTVTIRNTTGTDHLSFDALGLPGFQFVQDHLDYGTRTHHTNMDVYDHASISDLMQASVVMASFVYHTAMRDQKLPRKPVGGKDATNGN